LRLYFRKERVNVIENIEKYLVFCDSKVRIVIVRVGARMDDSIHVKIEIICSGQLGVRLRKDGVCRECEYVNRDKER
jgi:hypothetical protein